MNDETQKVLGDQTLDSIFACAELSFRGGARDDLYHSSGLTSEGKLPAEDEILRPCPYVSDEFLAAGAGGDLAKEEHVIDWKEVLCLGGKKKP